jgi:hypothetical protein
MPVWLKSVCTEGHFTRLAGTGVTDTLHVALTAHALQSGKVWLKSVGNEGHFTREGETVFYSRLASSVILRGGNFRRLVAVRTNSCNMPNFAPVSKISSDFYRWTKI